MEAPRIFLGIPCHDCRHHYQFSNSLIRLAASGQVSLSIKNILRGGIHKARNTLAAEFLKSGLKKCLFLDTDMGFEPGDVLRLYQDDLPIVSALYTHKSPPNKDGVSPWIMRQIPGIFADPVTGIQRVHAAPTGFLMVDREVFLKIAQDFPEIAYTEDWNDAPGETRWDFFPEGPLHDPEFGFTERIFGTEDFGFCHLAQRAQFDIHMDTRVYVKHWDGITSYPQNPPKTYSLTNTPEVALA